MTPDKLETSLREIFRLASLWDCILLLDEVDTFFSQRSRADTATTKNALVSVFLRVLDYYNGILFLTTNRAGVLDEAFKSRIHFKIYYPDLTEEQTLDIWKLNIQRVSRMEEELAKLENREPLQVHENELLAFAKQIFIAGEKQRRGTGRWNGRQIRNAFQVARSLAYYEQGMREERQRQAARNSSAPGPAETRDGSLGPPVLEVRHFKTMYDITASFENYRTAVHGGITDADIALEAEYRYDKYRDAMTERLKAEYRDEYLNAVAPASGGGAADETGADTGDVAGTATVAMTGTVQFAAQQQHWQQHGAGGDHYPGDSLPPGHYARRVSFGSRDNGNSFIPGVGIPSQPKLGHGLIQTHPHPRPTPSPRLGPHEATYPTPEYGTPQGNSMYTVDRTAVYHEPQQYGDMGRGVPTPRGTATGISEDGMPYSRVGGGKDCAQPDYFGTGGPGGGPFSPSSREGPGMRRATGLIGSGGLSAGAGYGNPNASHGRHPPSGLGQGEETDLFRD